MGFLSYVATCLSGLVSVWSKLLASPLCERIAEKAFVHFPNQMQRLMKIITGDAVMILDPVLWFRC